MQGINVFMFGMIGCLMLVSVTQSSATPTTHHVGGDYGWKMPTYPTFYQDWAKKSTFAVGDSLHFRYEPGMSTVVSVTKEDYDHCTSRNTLYTYFNGDTTILLDKPGQYYYFNNIGKHCETGQKLWVTVN